MLDVCLLGTSGMMPLPRRALTALMTRFNGSSLLIDCGEGTQVSIREQGWSIHSIDTICITHVHGDHISGLPGLLLSMGNAERTEPLTIIGPKGTKRVVEALLIIAQGLPFEIYYIELTERLEQIERDGYYLEAFRVNHTVPCYGYSQIIRRAGKFDMEKAKENQVPMKVWSRLQKGEDVSDDGMLYTPDMVLGEARKGLKITYCTDSRPISEIAECAKKADLFICEGMYGEEDMAVKAKENKHMTFGEAASLAKEAEVAELWLTHYSPSLIRPEEYMEKTRKIFPHAKPGKDRKNLVLNFDKDE
ncbi:MAG: ribonuclease Z [Lachnospiraceae bacterium]|nr:ribonuclease Z [Lachnospiraceae bacterium]